MNKRQISAVGLAALKTMSEEEVRADPAGAMEVAMAAMRATLAARAAVKTAPEQTKNV